MSRFTFPLLAVWGLLAAGLLLAQSAGRFDENKRLGLQYAADGKFDRAAAKLEEIWDQDQTDPMVAEYLAIAYLNGDDRKDHPELQRKAFDLMDKSLHLGGKATLLVHHSHEKMTWLQGRTLNNYCSGKLSYKAGHLTYSAEAHTAVSAKDDHSFDSAMSDLKITGPVAGDDRGMFQIKTKSRDSSMVPATWNKTDAEMFLALIQKSPRE